MAEPNFEKCTEVANKILGKQTKKVTRVRDLHYDKNIIFDSIQNYAIITNTPLENFLNDTQALSEGCCISLEQRNVFIVLYNSEIQSKEKISRILAREVGHIYLEHKKTTPVEQIEADYFANQLLMA